MKYDALLALSPNVLRQLSDAFKAGRLTVPVSNNSLESYLPAPLRTDVAASIDALLNVGLTANTIAVSLELLAEAKKRSEAERGHVNLVWTGHEPQHATSLDTSVVVDTMFRNVRRSILISTYVINEGKNVFRRLAQSLDANELLACKICCHLPLEDRVDPNEAVRIFGKRFKDWHWPGKKTPALYCFPQRQDEQGKSLVLHAKFIVADEEDVFISSANFTGAAHERNIEAGVQLRSPSLAAQLIANFESLRKAELIIPVPL